MGISFLLRLGHRFSLYVNDSIVSASSTDQKPGIPLAMIDPEFAKKQLDILTREWYMHPNGQLPAYEWNFGGMSS